jgi:hypothetical protein
VTLLATGCGIMKTSQNGEPVRLHHRVDRTYTELPHRVALSTVEVLNAEFASVNVVMQNLKLNDRFDRPNGSTPDFGEVKLPADLAAFWLDGVKPSGPVIADFQFCEIQCKDREGREVQAMIRPSLDGSNPGTTVSIQIGRRGDDASGYVLLAKIADRVAKPRFQPGSIEENNAFQDLFGPRPGEAAEKSRAITSGETWNKRY